MLRHLTKCAKKLTAVLPPPKPNLQLGSASVDSQMQDIEREAMDIQLQDKLLEYKSQMGLLTAGANDASKQIGAGAGSKSDDLLDDVLLNEANEQK